MWAAGDNEATYRLWQTFSSHQWKKGGRIPAQQPSGWAQIKYGMHVRSEPKGEKVRGLVKNNLVPVWELTESRWAAITPERDEWIYLGDPNLVEVNLDTKSTSPQSFQLSSPGPRFEFSGSVRYGHRTLRSGETVEVYHLLGGWARIHPMRDEWVNASYLRKAEPVPADSLPNPASQLSTAVET
jgi:hypothetical protein